MKAEAAFICKVSGLCTSDVAHLSRCHVLQDLEPGAAGPAARCPSSKAALHLSQTRLAFSQRCCCALQDMKRRGQWGQVVNISSMSGHRVANGGTGGAFYSATKHAVKALTEGLRQEVRMRDGQGLMCALLVAVW